MDDRRLRSHLKPPPARRGIKKPRARNSTPGWESASEFIVFGERARREFENSPSPMRIFDYETMKFLAVNDAAVKFYGYTREEFLALTLKDTRHPDEHAAQLAALKEPAGYFRHKKARRQIKKSGEIVVVEVVTQDILFNGRKARLNLTIDVTERERMVELLRLRKQEFETLAENLPDLVARFDRRHRFVYVNSAVEKLLGIPRHELIEKTQRELGMPKALVAKFERSLDEAIAAGVPHTLEFSVAGTGGERLFEAYHVPERDAAGQVSRVLCFAHDITERKKTEEDLRRQKKLLTAIIDNLPVGVFIKDAATLRLLMINRANQVTVKYPKEGAIGKTPHELFPKEQADAFCETDRKALESGQMVEIPEQEVIGRGEKKIIQHIRKVPLFDEQGRPWLLVGIADDITERKRAEQALHESNEFLRSVIESSRDCIKVLDLEGRLQLMNSGGQRLLEIDDLTPLFNTEWLEFWRGTDHAAARAALDAARLGGVGSFEGYCPTRKGSPRWWDVVVTPILDADGKPARLLAVSRDITNRKQAELAAHRSAELARLLESLARAANEAITPEVAMNACLERICRHGNWVIGRVEIFERGRPKDTFGRSTWYAPERERFAEFIRISNERVHNVSGPFVGRVLRERTAVWIDDLQQRAGFGRWDAAIRHGLRSAFAFPIIVRGDIVAIMEVFSEETRSQDPLTMGAAQSLASQLARIVERERAHQANAGMAAIVESSQDAIVSRMLDGTILTWNSAAERLFGYTAAEIVGQNIDVLHPLELKAEIFRRQGLLLRGLAVQAYETARVAKDGRRVHVSTSPAPIRDSSGKVCGVSTIIRDITERKLAEQALRESEERFRQLAENIDQVFWINTPTVDNNLYVSPAYEKIWGKSRESLRQDPNSWRASIHPEDLPRLRDGVTGIARGEHLDVEYRIIRPDGTIRWIRDRSYPMKAGDGTPLVCGIAEDITVQKRAEEERLIHAVHQRDVLVGEIHHRIKNNLQGVVGLLRQKIRKNPAITPDIEETISQLQSVALVYGLQETRPDGLLSLAEMVEAICASAEGLIGGHVDRIFERKSPRPACVAGSEAVSIAVALNELIFNALKHQPAEAGKKHAQVRLSETRNAAEIRITNRGRLPKVFDFSAGRAVGNGLELVRTLLASPGASIDFSNGRNKVEVVLRLSPPLLAARQTSIERRGEHGRANGERAATAHTGRGRRPAGAGRAG